MASLVKVVSKVELEQHLEVMQHEISDYDLVLSQQGYRVDGSDGIKITVESANSKSVDYFYLKNDNCIFVEFTDIARGEEDLLPLINLAHSDELSEDMSRPLKKMLKAKTKDELTIKFKDSHRIYGKIPAYYHDYPQPFSQSDPKISQSDPKTFYIVHAPVNAQLPIETQNQLADFLTRLKSQVSDSLDDDICERVKLMLVDNFANQE